MVDKLSVRQFLEEFSDETACLERIMATRYGLRHVCRSCGKEAQFERLPRRRAYACSLCGATVYPCVGTIFERSQTPLRLWFYALYLFSVRSHGVSSRELQRELGVTYKTAWRMAQQIRSLMQQVNASASLSRDLDAPDERSWASGGAGDALLPLGPPVPPADDDPNATMFRRQTSKVHGHISPKYAGRYYAEFTFRSHHSGPQHMMFLRLIDSL